jgi:hypothetical protein
MEECMRKLLLAVGMVLVAGVGYASAAPIKPIAISDDNGIVLAACMIGNPNCVKGNNNSGLWCYNKAGGCQIDDGDALGATCQGSGTCGLQTRVAPGGSPTGGRPSGQSLTQPKQPVQVK